MNVPHRPPPPLDLRAPGAILLLSCYELGHQPMGLASPAAWLRRAGYAPHIQDLAVERLDESRLRRAAFVGISVPMHTALALGLRIADRIRHARPTAHICFYGLYAVLNRERLLLGPADSVIGGEYEPPLTAWIEILQAGIGDPPPGVSLPGRESPPNLARADHPPPDRGGLPPLSSYARMLSDGSPRLAGYVETTRGCRHHCRHCPIPPVYGGRFVVIDRATVLADIRRLAGLGARHITFGDPDFLNGPGHGLAIARAMHGEYPDMTFDFTAKVSHLLRHAERLPELAGYGAVFVVSAVESLSDTVLTHLDKGHTRADVEAALVLTREAGIALRPSLLPFTPWSTLADYLELLEFVARQGLIEHLEPVQLAIRLLVPPGSLLLECEAFAPYRGPLDPGGLTHRWEHPDPRMETLHRRVSEIVEHAAAAEVPVQATFADIWREAHALAAAGNAQDRATEIPLPIVPASDSAPRLSEPWFC